MKVRRERGGYRSEEKIWVCICVGNKNSNGIFVNICGAGRGGSVNICIRPRPAPSIGAKFLNRNCPATLTGRVKPAQGGSVQNCHIVMVWGCNDGCRGDFR